MKAANRLYTPFSCLVLWVCVSLLASCAKNGGNSNQPGTPPEVKEAVYDETGCLYTSYKGLVMAGYQGWFAAAGDASERGWYHYQNGRCGGFFPGCAAIDFWPDMTE